MSGQNNLGASDAAPRGSGRTASDHAGASDEASTVVDPLAAVVEARGKRIIRWVEEHWGTDRACPFCGHVEWDIDPIPLVLERLSTDVSLLTRAAISFHLSDSLSYITVTCANCAQVVFLNAYKIGAFGGTE
jgi:hypothetical protein